MRLTSGLCQSALHHPHRTATVFGDRRRSYAEVLDRISRLASGLIAMGARSGDRIGILALNSDAYYEAYYAILRAGCIVVPFNTRWAIAEHLAALADCEPRMLLVDQHFVKAAAEMPASVRDHTLYIDEARGPHEAEAIIKSSSPMADHSGCDEQPAAIFYTGGTTGRSKGVVLSHDNLINNFLAASA